MTVLELKQALAKYGGDFDNFHVVWHDIQPDSGVSYELVCGVAYPKDLIEIEAVFLCGQGAVEQQIKNQDIKE